MQHTTRLKYIMGLSWEIQRIKRCERAKALQSAWAISLNEDVTIFYLVKRYSHESNRNMSSPQSLQLFKEN